MANERAAFDILFDLLQQVRDDQMDLAAETMRRHNAGLSLDPIPNN